MANFKTASRVKYMRDSAIYMRGLFDSMTDPNMKSFGGGAPAREALPMDLTAAIASEVLKADSRGFEALQYSNTFGLQDLRQAVCDQLLEPTGVHEKPENIQITSGGLETMYLCSQLVLSPGDVVLTESPSFMHVTDTFNMFEAKAVGCRCDENGIDPDDVEEKIKKYDAKMVYVVSTFDNPTGRTLSAERREALAELGSRYGILILEDDPYRDVRYSGEVVPAIRTFDKTGNTIMACSFSKIFAPGSRLGFAVADEDVIYQLRDMKIATNSQPPGISEVLAAEYFKRGCYQENLKKMCAIYRERRDVMMVSMDEFFPAGTAHTKPDGGYYVWVTFPEGLDTKELQKESEKQHFTFLTGGDWFPQDSEKYKNTARFNFSTQPPEVIREGMKVIGDIAKKMI